MIVKVQRSLNAGKNRVLIYDEAHNVLFEGELTKALSLWFGRAVKFFAEAELRDTKLHLLHKVPYQDW